MHFSENQLVTSEGRSNFLNRIFKFGDWFFEFGVLYQNWVWICYNPKDYNIKT